jgi:hypothetical protein
MRRIKKCCKTMTIEIGIDAMRWLAKIFFWMQGSVKGSSFIGIEGNNMHSDTLGKIGARASQAIEEIFLDENFVSVHEGQYFVVDCEAERRERAGARSARARARARRERARARARRERARARGR